MMIQVKTKHLLSAFGLVKEPSIRELLFTLLPTDGPKNCCVNCFMMPLWGTILNFEKSLPTS